MISKRLGWQALARHLPARDRKGGARRSGSTLPLSAWASQPSCPPAIPPCCGVCAVEYVGVGASVDVHRPPCKLVWAFKPDMLGGTIHSSRLVDACWQQSSGLTLRSKALRPAVHELDTYCFRLATPAPHNTAVVTFRASADMEVFYIDARYQ